MANEFKIKNGLVSDGNIVVTGSITATGGINISGSIASSETASFAPSYTLSSSFNSYTSSASSSVASLSSSVATTTSELSSSIGSLSGSIATTTSGLASRIGSVETKTGSYATTGSNIFIGDQTITGSICSNGNIVTTGQIVAQTINVQQVTSSIVYSCGSNIFGNVLSNTQQFTGSILATGSLTIAGPLSATTIYGSTVVCSPVGKFTTCIDAGSGTFSSSTNALNVGNSQNSAIALSTFGKTSTSGYATANNYLQIGAGENATSSTRLIGFGYSITANTNQPTYIGYIETSNTDNTKGSLIFGTRDVTTDTAPTTRLTITSGGSAIFQGCIGICNGGAINMTIPNGNNGGAIRMACCTGANEGDMFLTGGGGTGILIAGSGKIGIGTVSPTEKLHLKDSTTGYVGLRLEGTGTYAGTDWTMYASSTNPSTADDFLGFYNNSTTDGATGGYKMSISKNGNVGINNTTTPCGRLQITLGTVAGGCFRTAAGGEAALTIEASGNSYLQFMNNSTSQTGIMFGNNCLQYSGMIWYRHDSKQLMLGAGGTETMYICGGNVGIGMSTPSQKLHVVGGFLQTAGNSSWYRNVFEVNPTSWTNVVGFSPQSNPQYTYGYINITASAYTNGTSAGGVTTSRWYYSITNNSISVSVNGSDIATGSQAPGVRLTVSSGTIYVQVQSCNGTSAAYTSVFVDAMLASGYVNGTYWTIA